VRRRSRTRRVLKWVGTVLCVLVAALWLASGWYAPGYTLYYGRGQRMLLVEFSSGILYAQHAVLNPAWLPRRVRRSHWDLRWVGRYPSFVTLQPVSCRKACYVGGTYADVSVSIWLLWLLIALPTAYLWWRDRRFPSGHCKRCGYSLRGLPEPRCPECGTAFEPAGDLP
jgi:hypothetical protein